MSQEKLNILLIEDEDPHAELIQRAFEEQNTRFVIHRVKSLGEARAEFRSKEPALIIADWRLPDGDSMELLPNQHDPLATPIILMTSYGNERIAVEALKSGALDYVVKSPESMLDMPHLAERAIEQWGARAERIRMQKALLESEAQFRLLAENASDMIARLSIDGIMLYVSPACKTILGYKPEDLTGTNCFDYIFEEEQQKVRQIFKTKPADVDKTFTVAYRALRKDGQYIWLETSARAVYDHASGQLVEIQTASRDITERKRAEEELRIAHQHLQEAYEKTIEGWVRALDLRDRETEGHTQRVTELALVVASKLGFTEEELAHIRRGALLHDMGKIAISDEILQKPGPLNEAEWEKMRRHPIYAYEMLSPIAYLHPALEIPFYHHERWNGSGYPHGLKGEQIPLAARLFAIVDVWDALRSDRPYRKELPRDHVIEYLQHNAGILFDPKLVNLFLEVIKTEDI
ncbi:MAG TPA: PAS domain S-box protein [Anaerolineales bacterium]|nr:PAS domain S-box protein [Anaerolineales bacterium]